jgi:hypothetical protein
MTEERAEAARKIRDASARKAMARQAEEKAPAPVSPDPAPAGDSGPVPDPGAPKGRDDA